MKKSITALILAAALLLGGCTTLKNMDGEPLAEEGTQEQIEGSGDIVIEPETDAELPEEVSFADLEDIEFVTASAGAWSTLLYIKADGSFWGEYHDYDAIKEEYCPNGMMAFCSFKGQFAPIEKVNDYTYKTNIVEINYDNEEGTQEIIDGILYTYTDPYGFDGAEDILIYPPGTPLSELSEEFKGWIGGGSIANRGLTTLPFYAINNEVNQHGFSGTSVKELARYAELDVAVREKVIYSRQSTEEEVHEAAYELCEVWDYEIESLWKYFERKFSEEEMRAIESEQREWEAKKEKVIKETAKEFADGATPSTDAYLKAAEMTKERFYELLKLFDKEGE